MMPVKSTNACRQAWWPFCQRTAQCSAGRTIFYQGIWEDVTQPFHDSMADLSCSTCIGSAARSEGTASNTQLSHYNSYASLQCKASLDMVSGSKGSSCHGPALHSNWQAQPLLATLNAAALGELQLLYVPMVASHSLDYSLLCSHRAMDICGNIQSN